MFGCDPEDSGSTPGKVKYLRFHSVTAITRGFDPRDLGSTPSGTLINL